MGDKTTGWRTVDIATGTVLDRNVAIRAVRALGHLVVLDVPERLDGTRACWVTATGTRTPTPVCRKVVRDDDGPGGPSPGLVPYALTRGSCSYAVRYGLGGLPEVSSLA